MRQDHPHNQIHRAEPQSELARRLAAGTSVEELMRRGEIGGQALGLLQIMAGHAGRVDGPRTRTLGSARSPLGTN